MYYLVGHYLAGESLCICLEDSRNCLETPVEATYIPFHLKYNGIPQSQQKALLALGRHHTDRVPSRFLLTECEICTVLMVE
eukprot:jgi/Botrbrau1/10914/Bobra.0025s0087.1